MYPFIIIYLYLKRHNIENEEYSKPESRSENKLIDSKKKATFVFKLIHKQS